MKGKKRSVLLWLGLVLALAAVAGLTAGTLAVAARPTPIGQVLAQAGSLHGKEVRVRGRVANAWGLLGRQFYLLEDDTEKVWISTPRTCPTLGQELTVAGKVNKYAQLPTFLGGFQGVLIEEARRQ